MGIVARQGHQQQQQVAGQLAVEPHDLAEVDRANHLAGQGEEVAGVRVGLEEPVAEYLLQDQVAAVVRQALAIDAGGF